jgi:hypothetical protein
MHLFKGFVPLLEADMAIAPDVLTANSKPKAASLPKYLTTKMNDKFIIKFQKNNT